MSQPVGFWSGDLRRNSVINEMYGQISSLRGMVSQQRREASQLRSQLSQVRESLGQRIEQLTRSLDAFVELTDLRATLALYDEPARIRHETRQVIGRLAPGTAVTLPVPLDDVSGYWLGPAVEALIALLHQGDATAPLATAEQRDPLRTAVLLSAGLARAGRADHAVRWLPTALGAFAAGTPVTRTQRALWITAAGGGFGATGTALLGERLSGMVEGLRTDDARAEGERWSELVDGLSSGAVVPPQIVRGDDAIRRCLIASARLSALRRLCIPGDADPAAPEPDATAHAPAAGPAMQPGPDLLDEILRPLVDEGSAEETSLLQRAAALRASIEDGADTQQPRAWDSEAGDPLDLLRSDAFDAARPDLGRVARHAGRRWLVDAAARLDGETAVDGPDEVTVKYTGGVVRVRAKGPDAGDLAMAPSRIRAHAAPDPRRRQMTIGMAAGGAVLVLAVVGWPSPLAVLAVLAGIGLLVAGGVQAVGDRRADAERLARQEAEIERVKRSASEAAAALANLDVRITEQRRRATADREAIRAHVTP